MQFCWGGTRLRRGALTWRGNANSMRRSSHHYALRALGSSVIRCIPRYSAVNQGGGPREAQEMAIFPCIWSAPMYSTAGEVAVKVGIFATLAPGDMGSMATDAYQARCSHLQIDTPKKYPTPANNMASGLPQGGSHNPFPRITAKGFLLHSPALPAIGLISPDAVGR